MSLPSSAQAKIDAAIDFEAELRERILAKASRRSWAAPLPDNFDLTGFCQWAKIGRTSAFKEIKAGRLKVRKLGDKSIIPLENAFAWRDALPTN